MGKEGEGREKVEETGDGDGYIFFGSDNNISYFSSQRKARKTGQASLRVNARGGPDGPEGIRGNEGDGGARETHGRWEISLHY